MKSNHSFKDNVKEARNSRQSMILTKANESFAFVSRCSFSISSSQLFRKKRKHMRFKGKIKLFHDLYWFFCGGLSPSEPICFAFQHEKKQCDLCLWWAQWPQINSEDVQIKQNPKNKVIQVKQKGRQQSLDPRGQNTVLTVFYALCNSQAATRSFWGGEYREQKIAGGWWGKQKFTFGILRSVTFSFFLIFFLFSSINYSKTFHFRILLFSAVLNQNLSFTALKCLIISATEGFPLRSEINPYLWLTHILFFLLCFLKGHDN